MILTADIGNSYVKFRYFDDNEKIIKAYDYTISEALNLNIADLHLPQKAIFSDVSEKFHHFMDFFNENGVKTIKMKPDLLLPVKICYKTPNSLGQDRLAAVCGAVSKFPNKNILVIDAGTAICFDFVDENANYIGGNISPGINLRFKSLNDYTSKLPLLNKEFEFVEIADNTELAVASGVLNGILYEINQYIQQWRNKSKNNIVILTGGDTSFLVNSIKYSIFADLNLVHLGLKRILDLNVE